MSKSLRYYQEEAISAYSHLPEKAMLVMPTGTGKTFTAMQLLNRYFQGKTIVWLAHSSFLLDQAKADNKENCPELEVIFETRQKIINDLKNPNLIELFGHTDVLIIDEAHHAASAEYKAIIEELNPDRILGLTATPVRADHLGLQEIFGSIVYNFDMLRAIKEGWIASPYIQEIKVKADIPALRNLTSDISLKQLARIYNTDLVNDEIVRQSEICEKPAIGFAVDCAHGKILTERCRAIGINAMYIDGKTKDRYEILNADWDILWNVGLCTEGVDLIQKVKTVLLGRPTFSEVLFTQMVGRGLRPKDTPPNAGICTVIDFRGNAERHEPCRIPTLLGLPDPPKQAGPVQYIGSLVDSIAEEIDRAYKNIQCLLKSGEIMKEWAKKLRVRTRSILFVRMPNGDLFQPTLRAVLDMNPMDSIQVKQQRIEDCHAKLLKNHAGDSALWLNSRGWHGKKASKNQLPYLKWFPDAHKLTRGQASLLMSCKRNGLIDREGNLRDVSKHI